MLEGANTGGSYSWGYVTGPEVAEGLTIWEGSPLSEPDPCRYRTPPSGLCS